MNPQPYLSIVIPAKNEAANLPALLDEIHRALAGEAFEVVVVDDGSTDASVALLRSLKREYYPALRILSHTRSLGQSTALYNGARAARGRWLATLDGDGQNDPADIPGMLALVRERGEIDGLQLVAGHRINRRDTAAKRWASRFANRLRRRLLRDGVPDTGCGLKLIEREAFLRLPYFDHMHRFIPALILRQHGGMVIHPVNHRPRWAGESNYGNLDRALVGVLDLFGVWWLIRRSRLEAYPRELEG